MVHSRYRSLFAVLVLLPFSFAGARGGDAASDAWSSAYAWLQVGRNLAEAEQWPLAQGSYIEAMRQLQEVSVRFPGYEPELVAFRIDALGEEIAQVQEKLAGDDHEAMRMYRDFIDSIETGEAQRYSDKLGDALQTFIFARGILEDIIKDRPEATRVAVSSQIRRLDDNISFLEKFLVVQRRSVAVASSDATIDWGTTRFVEDDDLPGDDGTLSAKLFPQMSLRVEGEVENGENVDQVADNSIREERVP